MKTRHPEQPAARPAAAGLRRPRLLVELAIIVGCKIAVVFTLWALFFNPSKRPQQSPETVADGVLGPAEAPPAATTPPPAP